jgi:hypothetical protein
MVFSFVRSFPQPLRSERAQEVEVQAVGKRAREKEKDEMVLKLDLSGDESLNPSGPVRRV